MTNFKDGKWHISKTADLGIKTGSNECRVLVFGNNNTGTNLVEKLITSQGCTPHAQGHAARRTPFWKHKLLTSEDLDRAKKANVDAVIVTTRHPYCWARGMKKAPYPKDQIKRNFVGLELGEVWKSGTEILPYEALISDEPGYGFQSFKSVLPAARNMTQDEFDDVIASPAKTHGHPRSLADAQLAASTQCKNELSTEEIKSLNATIDHELAAKFGYWLL